MTQQLSPILTAHLYGKLEDCLLDLLRSLSPEEWEKQTVSPKWKVKDVVAHMLDTQLRKLSMGRDGNLPPAKKFDSRDEFLAFINGLNQDGVKKYRTLSPKNLIAQMEATSKESAAYHESLDLMAPAIFGVSWAGEEKSLNWFDTARELTERWHHQQQIRLAVDKPGIMTREFYFPVLDCFMRALPFHYREVPCPAGQLARFNVSGDCGGSWFLYRNDDAWKLIAPPEGELVSETTIPQEIAWRIFTKGIDRESARAQITVRGDPKIGLHILNMIAIIG
ncbi:MAG: maleylpyruvate isomerase N-terminal domain-containing protein [Acidobacteria bacterium]|nr:maleylpyruvate isomerase N-terminal domain-containing protein [Acidobacteriota bacterium]